jgi:hypothetical protein
MAASSCSRSQRLDSPIDTPKCFPNQVSEFKVTQTMHSVTDLRGSAKRVVGRIFFTALLATAASSAKASILPLGVTFDNTQGGNASGPNVDIGWEFSISSPIIVTQLGFWDESGDGLGESHPVAIWNATGAADLASALVSTTVPSGTSAAPVPGTWFRMVAWRTQRSPLAPTSLGQGCREIRSTSSRLGMQRTLHSVLASASFSSAMAAAQPFPSKGPISRVAEPAFSVPILLITLCPNPPASYLAHWASRAWPPAACGDENSRTN